MMMAKMFINVMMAKMMTMTNLIHVKSEVLETMMQDEEQIQICQTS